MTNMDVNHQTGELKITNIKPDQSGEYEVKVNTKDILLTLPKRFSVYVSEVELVRLVRTKDESIYLNTTTEPQADDVIEWKFNNTVLTKVNKKEQPRSAPVFIERFKDRLYLDLFGSLIITNIKTGDSGLYDVHITNNKHIIHKRFNVTVTGVFSADVTLIVMKGDNVTLLINPDEIKGAERLFWKFNNKNIATIDLEEKNGQVKYNYNEAFGGRLNLDRNTGYLTINNIRTNDTGEYKLEIRGWKIKYNSFSVTVNEVELVLQTKDKSIYLDTATEPQADDVIEWKFENTVLTKVDKTEHPRSAPVFIERFKDRIYVVGSLIITNIKTEDSGLYDVHITNNKHIIHKRFKVTVTESSSGSHQERNGPGLFVVVIMLLTTLVMPVTGDY
ncbi:uncharacterized protein [Misgurnus anguillicaudatus]|uniref:uncharacterized protein isoform X2 n=1 Tax=Misgurnus anguillicaudatus TaxID=75329 RepID=UPI003CCF800C